MLSKISQIHHPDEIINRIQSTIISRINTIADVPFLSGNLLESVVLPAGTTFINHKLNRAYVGYLILTKSSAATVYDTPSADSSVTLGLVCSAPVTLTLWVF